MNPPLRPSQEGNLQPVASNEAPLLGGAGGGFMKRLLYRSYHRSAGLKHRLQRLLTPAGWFVLAGIFVCGGIGIDTNQAMAYQAFAFFGAALIVAALWRFWPQPRLEFRRELPRYGSAGTKLTYRVHVKNGSATALRGLWLIDDAGDPRPSLNQFLQSREPAEDRRNVVDRAFGYYRWAWLVAQNRHAVVHETPIPPIAKQSQAEVPMELLPLRRGPLRFESAAIGCRDILGLSRRLTAVPARQSVLILPKRYFIPPVALPGHDEYQQGGVALASSVGESEEFVSLRDYRRGDPLRHIHWKSTARTGQLIVKEFQNEFFVRHAMILDTFQREQAPELFEEAVSVAASFACTIQSQDSLLDLLFMGPQAYCFTAGRGVGHTEQLIEILASVEPCREKPFAVLEHLVLEHLPRVSGALCVFLSWDDSRQDLVRKIRASGVPLWVLVIVPPSLAERIDPGPMRDLPDCFHTLEIGKVAEGLMRLGGSEARGR
jgi:uncharacterized protein (DUF58 family)